MASVTVANISHPFIGAGQYVTFLPPDALSLTAALEAVGHDVDFRDFQNVAAGFCDPQDPANATSFFAGAAPTVVVTTPHDAMPLAVLLAERLKVADPDRTVIMAGYGPRHVASALLQQFRFVDFVITDSPEVSAPLLIDAADGQRARIPGIAYRDRAGVHITPSRTASLALDSLPMPAYHKVDLSRYSEVMVVSAQGCPFNCGFCVRSGMLCEKSIERVIAEVSLLRKTYGQRQIFFYDQTFTLNKRRVLDLCRALREAGLTDVEWACTGRLNTTDVEMMEQMAASGCKMLYFGVESGSDPVLKKMNKRITRAMAERVIEQAQRFFSICAFFIWGFPFESMDDFGCTVEMIRALSAQGVAPVIYVLSPLPSSPLLDEYRDQLSFSRAVWEANWPEHLSNRTTRDAIAALIEPHPEVFPGFFSCDRNIEAKLRIIRDLGLETRFPDV